MVGSSTWWRAIVLRSLSGSAASSELLDLDLVGIEGDKSRARLHLVVRRLVAPDGVFRAALERVIGRVALEWALRLVARAFEPIHLHVRSREVIDRRVSPLLHADRALRIRDHLAAKLHLQAPARRLGNDAPVGALLETGSGIHVAILGVASCAIGGGEAQAIAAAPRPMANE